jgi:anti-anti-sigma factor
MPFSVQVYAQEGLTVVALAGELDMEGAADLRTLFDMLVEDRHVNVLVDLRLLTFCDSMGLSALIHGYQACHIAGGSFRAIRDTGIVSRLLSITGVRGLLIGEPELWDPALGISHDGPDGSGRAAPGWQWTSDGPGGGQVSPDNTDAPTNRAP